MARPSLFAFLHHLGALSLLHFDSISLGTPCMAVSDALSFAQASAQNVCARHRTSHSFLLLQGPSPAPNRHAYPRSSPLALRSLWNVVAPTTLHNWHPAPAELRLIRLTVDDLVSVQGRELLRRDDGSPLELGSTEVTAVVLNLTGEEQEEEEEEEEEKEEEQQAGGRGVGALAGEEGRRGWCEQGEGQQQARGWAVFVFGTELRAPLWRGVHGGALMDPRKHSVDVSVATSALYP